MTARFPGIYEERAVIDRAYSLSAHSSKWPISSALSRRERAVRALSICLHLDRPRLQLNFELSFKRGDIRRRLLAREILTNVGGGFALNH